MSSSAWPVNAYAGNPLDRASVMRADADWVAARLVDPRARIHAVWNGAVLIRDLTDSGEEGASELAVLPGGVAQQAANPEQDTLFLGLDGEIASFAVHFDGPADPAEGPLKGFGRFEELRAATPLLSPTDAAIAATAKAVFEWSRRHRFCAACGQPTWVTEAGWRRQCPACRTEHFPRTDPVVIMLPVFGDRCLLGRQASWPAKRFSALAGFLEPGESIEEACAREVHEECGLTVTAVRYHSTQPWPYPCTLMIGLIAEVSDDNAAPDQTELEEVRWFTRREIRALLAGEAPDALPTWKYAIAYELVRTWAGA